MYALWGRRVHPLTTHSSRLSATLARLHAAIVGTSTTSSLTSPTPTATTRPSMPSVVAVRLSPAHPTPPPPPRPSCAPLETVTDLSALARGPRRLLELLHGVGVATVAARGYRVAPSQVTLHQPQELLAAALGCHVVTVWRWTQALREAGLVDARAHFTTSKGTTRADGTLYAVTLQAGHRAHLTHADLSHQYRDLDADRAAGRTAWSALQGSDQKPTEEWISTLRAWAVTPGSISDSRYSPDPCNGPSTLQDVVYMLPLMRDAHPSKRPALVGVMASTVAHALGDQHSRRWYCRLIWQAWEAEVEGRHGLQALAAQLARLQADLAEWPDLRSPGALLASRLSG